MPKDSKLKLHLFGAPRLEKSGKPLVFARRKTFDLLAYLALHPAEHPRERVAAALWMDASEESARLSLRVAVSDLRKTLGDDCLADTSGLQLDPKFPLWIDTREFQRLADSRAKPEDWLAALELCTGELLPRHYDEWILAWRDDFERMRIEANMRLAQYQRAQGEHALAVEFARAVLDVEPAREPACQIAMSSLEALGEREAALEQYAACVQSLSEAGAEPSIETQALYRRIQKSSEAAARPPSNLPRPITSFIGREDQLNEIETLLTQTRLLTITGAGGSGKTRLAIQAADESAHNYEGGAWWVELASLSDGALIPQSIAAALNLKEKGGADLLDQIAAFIGERNLLLALDNCEHLLADCARVTHLLIARCPALTVLATSRAPLGLDGEVAWPTPTLFLPEADSPNSKELQKNEAVRLFAERARAANASFQLNPRNAPRVAELCRRLDGIPLAIELAAAQLGNLSLEGILARLDDFLDLGADAHAPRHATLRAAIQWSYDLLNPVERLLFNRLSVFAGGWTLDSATLVAAGYDEQDVILSAGVVDDDFPPIPVTGEMVTQQALESLIRKALVQPRYSNAGLRYDMLDTLREFGREMLEKSGEAEKAAAAHFQFFIGLAEELWQDIYSERENAALNRMEQEQDNLRLAWAHGFRSAEWKPAQYAIASQGHVWRSRGHYAECRETLEQWLAHASMKTVHAARAELFNSLGLTHWQSGNFARAREFFQQALADYRTLGIDKSVAMVLINTGGTYVDEEQFDDAQKLFEEGLELARTIGYERALGFGLNNLSNVLVEKRDFIGARAALEESIALRRKMGDLRGLGVCLSNLATVEAEEENYPRAYALFLESFEIRAQLADRRGAILAGLNLVKFMQMESRLEGATRLLGFMDETLAQLGIQMPKDAREFQAQAAVELRQSLGAETFDKLHQSGRTLTLETAVEWLKSSQAGV